MFFLILFVFYFYLIPLPLYWIQKFNRIFFLFFLYHHVHQRMNDSRHPTTSSPWPWITNNNQNEMNHGYDHDHEFTVIHCFRFLHWFSRSVNWQRVHPVNQVLQEVMFAPPNPSMKTFKYLRNKFARTNLTSLPILNLTPSWFKPFKFSDFTYLNSKR